MPALGNVTTADRAAHNFFYGLRTKIEKDTPAQTGALAYTLYEAHRAMRKHHPRATAFFEPGRSRFIVRESEDPESPMIWNSFATQFYAERVTVAFNNYTPPKTPPICPDMIRKVTSDLEIVANALYQGNGQTPAPRVLEAPEPAYNGLLMAFGDVNEAKWGFKVVNKAFRADGTLDGYSVNLLTLRCFRQGSNRQPFEADVIKQRRDSREISYLEIYRGLVRELCNLSGAAYAV